MQLQTVPLDGETRFLVAAQLRDHRQVHAQPEPGASSVTFSINSIQSG